MPIVNAAEAARLCGVTERTMRTWLKAGRITGRKIHRPGQVPSWEIDSTTLPQRSVHRNSGEPTGDLEARVIELERRIAALEAVSRGAQQPSRRTNTLPATPRGTDGAVGALQQHVGATPSAEPKKPHPRPLPDGWVPATTWAKDHGIWEKHGRSLDRYVQAHRAPEGEPWGSWSVNERMARWYDTYAALDPAQQQQLAEVARRMWPQDWRE